jgi:hypothetical protein
VLPHPSPPPKKQSPCITQSYWEDYNPYGLWKPKVIFTIHNLNYGQKRIAEAADYCQKFTTVSPTYAFETGEQRARTTYPPEAIACHPLPDRVYSATSTRATNYVVTVPTNQPTNQPTNPRTRPPLQAVRPSSHLMWASSAAFATVSTATCGIQRTTSSCPHPSHLTRSRRCEFCEVPVSGCS